MVMLSNSNWMGVMGWVMVVGTLCVWLEFILDTFGRSQKIRPALAQAFDKRMGAPAAPGLRSLFGIVKRGLAQTQILKEFGGEYMGHTAFLGCAGRDDVWLAF